MIEGNETAHLGTISGPKPHAKTIGNYLMFSILHALERAAQLDLISDYARLPDKGGKPDFGVNLDEDRDTFLVTYGDFKVEIEAKNRGRSPKKGKIWDGYPAFNRLDYDEVHDKITGKNWSVAPDYQILVVSELSPDIFTEPALGLIEQY